MATEKTYGIWTQANGIEIEEVDYDYDAHAFGIYVDGRHITTIYADSPEETEEMIACLDNGGDVKDWEDGNGRSVGTLIAERTGDGLRKTLKRLEDEGMCYTEELSPEGAVYRYGTFWDDEVNGIFYGLATDDLHVYVDDLTDEELNDVIIKEM